MRNFLAALFVVACIASCHAQAQKSDTDMLAAVRAKYDSPCSRNLQSFDCAVDFSWNKHWLETTRVGDEGTDEEIAEFVQPIRNRVVVTAQDAVLSGELTPEQKKAHPSAGMAEGLLKHAVRFSLRTWLVASNNQLLPPLGSPVHFEPKASGYEVDYKVQTFDVAASLDSDMGLLSMGVKGAQEDRQDFAFHVGPQGLVLGSWTMGEDGNFKPGNHMIFEYTYQDVGGFQIPAKGIVNRESHREVWRYALTDCKVTTK